MGIFTAIGKWLAGAFKKVKDVFVPMAVVITQEVKTAEDNGTLPTIAEMLDAVTGTHISTEANALIQAGLPKILATELAIEGLPDNPTEADIKTFEDNVIAAIAGKDASAKSQFYTTFAAQVYGLIHTAVTGQTTPLTFAQIVTLIETAYQDFLADKNAPVVPPIGHAAEVAPTEGTTS